MPSSLIGPRTCSQQNVFNVLYLGRAPLPNSSNGDSILQRTLFDMYIRFKEKKNKTNKLNPARIVLSSQTISLVNWNGDEETHALSSVAYCKAVIFTGSKMKVNRSKVYRYAFEHLAEAGKGEAVSTAMEKGYKYLLKAKRHEPLVVCVIRKDLGPRMTEVHAFVSTSVDQAMGLSLTVDMARRMRQGDNEEEAEKNGSYLFTPAPRRIQGAEGGEDEELPRIMKKLHELGGRGSVVSPVVRASNVNLIWDDLFSAPKPSSSGQKQLERSVTSVGNAGRQSRVFQLEQKDVVPTPIKLGQHNRASSFEQLSYASIFQEDLDFKFVQKPKENARGPQVNRSKSIRGNCDDPRMRAEGVFVSSDPSGGGEKPTKPVAMVQPRKTPGIKVFPFGYDRTGLIPDRDKLKKKKSIDDGKSTVSTRNPDTLSMYSQVSKQGEKIQKNQFVIKPSTEEYLSKV